ncbi:MAG: acyl-CoA dehydrogenase family protein [Nostoc sp. NOS(2021)]|uniref:acyl-CoA dehydrogenase family protein n=1 Tax=Nostoc sp. NOS(2021) TaxID=2815407 RepID=UPI0025FA1CC9|nr:acyl-CoA dehydrogenase family protein [Nostoc sp. NOS(2021)]MBN3895524.1 acyl-CoA dehydrogenase family protein [Nostoc sp. NOS(2021)]
MVLSTLQETKDYIALAASLGKEFSKTAVERDAKGGSPTAELNRLRESGLLKLLIPEEYGGFGQTWITALKVVREIAKADGSLGQLLGYHYVNSVLPELNGTPEQKARFYSETTRNNWFWGDAVNPRDPKLVLTPDGKNFRLNGTKNFATGSTGSDIIVVTAARGYMENLPVAIVPKHREGVENLPVAIVPTHREGVVLNDDWDYIGQRQTDSGSVNFNNVLIHRDEILGNPNSKDAPTSFASLVTPAFQCVFVNFYLGIALGAFEEGKQYTLSGTRPWIFSPAHTAAKDPYIIEQYGNLWVSLISTISHVDYVNSVFQSAWEKGEHLTATERGETAVTISTAKVLTTRVALDVTSKIFEVMGTRAAATKYRFDRFWRNVRTHTLHDPVAYKVHEVGDWVLNEQIPPFTIYT